MMSKQFWLDAAERAIKTFFEILAVAFGAGVTIISIDWKETLAMAATGALVSVAVSIASAGKGDSQSPSLVKATTAGE